jgi:hypothetical protein
MHAPPGFILVVGRHVIHTAQANKSRNTSREGIITRHSQGLAQEQEAADVRAGGMPREEDGGVVAAVGAAGVGHEEFEAVLQVVDLMVLLG